mgnify:CR=1 FL=1
MLRNITSSAAALYDGGWRSTDKEQMMDEYDLEEQEAEAICNELEKMEAEIEAESRKQRRR